MDMTTDLFRQYQQNPSRQLRDRIFNHHRGLAYKIAHQFANICDDQRIEDYIQLASLGLITAIERFDPDQGKAFSSFACPHIKGEILHYLRDKAWIVRIPRGLQALYQRGMKLKCMQQLTDAEVAIALGVTPEKWEEAKAIRTQRLPLSIDYIIYITSEEAVEASAKHTRLCLSLAERLTAYDKPQENNLTIDPLPVTAIDPLTQKLLKMFFLENKSFKEVRQSAIASGIKAKEVKPLLLNAVLSLA